MEDSLKKRYTLKLISNIIVAIIGIILVAIVPTALGPIAYGQFVYIRDFFMKIIGFLDMGTSTAFFIKLSADNRRKELIKFYFFYSLIVLILLFIFIFFINYFNISKKILPNIPREYIYMGLFFSFFTWFTQIFIKISDAYALTVSVEFIKIVHKIVSLVLLLYFVYATTFDLNSYFIFHYIALVSFLWVLIWLFIKKEIFKNILNFQFSISHLSKEFIEYCHPLVLYSVVGLIIGFLDIWMLQTFGGSKETGFYGLAYSLVVICFLFTSAMTPIITREFAKNYAEKNLKKMKSLFFRYIPMLYSLSAFFGVFLVFQSQNILDIFVDSQFKEVSFVLAIMGFYPPLQTYGQLSGSIFYATGQTNLYKNIGITTMIIGLFLSLIFLFILNWGAVGLALKVTITGLLGVNIQLYFNSKILDFDIKYFIWHQIYSIIFFIVLSYVSSSIVTIEIPLVSFFVSAMVYTLLVIIATYIFPSIFATNRDEIKYYLMKAQNVIKNKVKK